MIYVKNRIFIDDFKYESKYKLNEIIEIYSILCYSNILEMYTLL